MIRKKPENREASQDAGAPMLNKPSRSYLNPTTKAVAHPVRSQILRALKEGDLSTVELEKITGETRYNLYHHLSALEQVGLIDWTMRDNKTKLYQLRTPETPDVTVTPAAPPGWQPNATVAPSARWRPDRLMVPGLLEGSGGCTMNSPGRSPWEVTRAE